MKIMLWFYEGVTPEEIAERLQRNVKPVRKAIAANRNLPVHQKPPPPKKRSGRPRITSAVQENRLRQYLTVHPFKTAKELKNEVAGWSHISVRCIQDICKKRQGMPSLCAAKKPLLTDKIVRMGMSFCKKHGA
jgi:hypothetical protein